MYIWKDTSRKIYSCFLIHFNRKKNVIFQFDYKKFLQYIKGELAFPEPKCYSFTLPEINGIEAGFSGASVLPKASKIIFTASVEDTDNAYDDGEILGSMIGTIDLLDAGISDTFEYCLIPHGEEKLKIESVTVDSEDSNEGANLILISDDDKGNSTLVKCKLVW
ncbi:MAG: hypothetical protein EA341_09145 [Mongoliibacter sp.]|uniref:DUF6929 family protein n=1 Tax=Mongoliibacter sp. TaxID=2022438 RepID=UPI0012F37755|nr:hypothetical protein [Mongoliibacter sp.]TVP49599.1 MAG: hypothetical protein EA341_09145 [Mongoliibacter sp.]